MGIGYHNIPTLNKIYKEWSYSVIEWAMKNDPKLINQGVISIRDAYSDMQDAELIQKIEEKYTKQNIFHKFDFEKINKKYQAKIKNIRMLQARSIGIGHLYGLVL